MKREFSDILSKAEDELLEVWKEQMKALLTKSLKYPINWGLAGRICWSVDINSCEGHIYFYQEGGVSIKVSSDFTMSSFKVVVSKASPELTFGYCRSFPSKVVEFQVAPINLSRLINDLTTIYP